MSHRVWSFMVLIGGLGVALPGQAWSAGASDAVRAAESPRPAARKSHASPRLPRNFAKLGLSPTQKEQVLAIEAKHLDRIQELRRQLKDAQRQMEAACAEVLTADQRKTLAELQAHRSAHRPSSEHAPKVPATERPAGSTSAPRTH